MAGDKVFDRLVDKLLVALPPGWELREDVKHFYLYYRGWVIAKFSAAESTDRIAHGIRWHTGVLSTLKNATMIRN